MRNGDHVQGSYSLVEPDGSLRVVDYHANDLTGFNAEVKRLGPGLHPTALPLAPIAVAALPPPEPLPKPLLHPLTFSPPAIPLARMPEPIPKPLATYPHSSFNIGMISKPIVVADPIIPIQAFNPLPVLPLLMPPEGLLHRPAPFTISGATYGKHGLVKSWSSGPIDLHGRSLTIRHKH